MTNINDKLQMYGKTSLVTGANGHLGSKISVALAECGSNLVLVDHHRSNFHATEAAISAVSDSKVISIKCDLSQEASRIQAINNIKSHVKSLNCLINNAAFVASSDTSGWSVPFDKQSLNAWNCALEVNLTAPFHLCQSLRSIMTNSMSANIINISSIYGALGPDWRLYDDTNMANPAAYSVSKGGLIQLTRWLATTLAPSIRVNSISPGGIFRNQDPRFVQRYESKCPLNRMATEDDVVGAVLYLASELSSYVTGENLYVDGGWSKW